MSRASLLAPVLVLCLCWSTPPPSYGASSKSAQPVLLVQALHRAARTPAGGLRHAAATELADALIQRLIGGATALEAWQQAGGRQGRALVIAVPNAGPLAEAVVERLRLVARRPEDVELLDGGAAVRAREKRPVILVVRPVWGDDALAPDPQAAAQFLGVRTPKLVLVDLTTPLVDGASWTADEGLASRSAAAAALGARYILEARASGQIPDVGALAAKIDLDPSTVDWVRIAVVQ